MIQAGKENILTLRVVGPIILSDKNIDGVGALQTPNGEEEFRVVYGNVVDRSK